MGQEREEVRETVGKVSRLCGRFFSSEFPYQTDPYFSEEHNEEGCYFQSIARVAWEEGGFGGPDLKERIKRSGDRCLEKGYIDERFTVLRPTFVFLSFGLVVKFTDKWESAERPFRKGERHILRMGYKDMVHFVVGKKGNRVGWDPWSEAGSLTGKHGEVLDKRVFVVIRKASDKEVEIYG